MKDFWSWPRANDVQSFAVLQSRMNPVDNFALWSQVNFSPPWLVGRQLVLGRRRRRRRRRRRWWRWWRRQYSFIQNIQSFAVLQSRMYPVDNFALWSNVKSSPPGSEYNWWGGWGEAKEKRWGGVRVCISLNQKLLNSETYISNFVFSPLNNQTPRNHTTVFQCRPFAELSRWKIYWYGLV